MTTKDIEAKFRRIRGLIGAARAIIDSAERDEDPSPLSHIASALEDEIEKLETQLVQPGEPASD